MLNKVKDGGLRKDGKVCVQCAKPLVVPQQKYCSYECAALQRPLVHSNPSPFRGKTSGTTGTISELRVAVDLLSKGCDVFRALSPNCPCDLAVLKEKRLFRIEVRTTYKNITGKIQRADNPRDDTDNIDIYAWVLPDEIIYKSRTETPRNQQATEFVAEVQKRLKEQGK